MVLAAKKVKSLIQMLNWQNKVKTHLEGKCQKKITQKNGFHKAWTYCKFTDEL